LLLLLLLLLLQLLAPSLLALVPAPLSADEDCGYRTCGPLASVPLDTEDLGAGIS
jgi:hypothetical protein